jgi:fumarate reductase subunit C
MSRSPYLREVPNHTWYFRHPRYIRYMVREITCIFIGAYTLMLLVGLARLAQGEAAYEGFLAALRTPGSVVFHLAALALAVYHTATWFNVTPKALPVQVGEAFVPNGVIAGVHYAGWAVVSLLILLAAGVI